MSLRGLGISDSDERAYRALLRQPDSVADPAAVQRLTALGFLTVAEDGAVTAVDPQVAIDRLVEARLGEVGTELSRITAARSALPSLLAERSAGQHLEMVERIEGRQTAQQRVWEITEAAGEILAMHRERPYLAAGILERTLRRLGRGVVYRSIVHRDLLAQPETADYLRRIHRAGDRHRVTTDPIQPLVIADRATAFVPIEPGLAGSGALLVRQPGIVAFLVDLFEQTWSRATDLEPDPPGLTDDEQQVLTQLDRWGKDETAARALGISVRTFRARVAVLMARLGAANRFQAGVRAKEKGWL